MSASDNAKFPPVMASFKETRDWKSVALSHANGFITNVEFLPGVLTRNAKPLCITYVASKNAANWAFCHAQLTSKIDFYFRLS